MKTNTAIFSALSGIALISLVAPTLEAQTPAASPVQVGQTAPDFEAWDEFRRPVKLSDLRGRAVVLSVFPSINTGVCAIQTREFNKKAASLGENVLVVSIARDIPEDFTKFCATHGIKNLLNLSDLATKQFGDRYALNLPKSKWLGRAAIVVDPEGKVVYSEYLKNLGHQPKYDAVLAAAQKAAANAPRFQMQPLPYASNALAPAISKATIDLHYGKHLRGYVNNLNKMTKGTPFEGKSLDEIVQKSEGALYNNAGQVANHRVYFNQFGAQGKVQAAPTGALLAAIDKKWGSLGGFQKAMSEACGKLFGSGWVWLVKDAQGQLSIMSTRNGDSPLRTGFTPLLGIDVWEHSYYLDYQNRRADHVKALWSIINWKVVDARFKS